MKIYLGFAKRDLHEWKQGELFNVQAHEPRGGDLDIADWREVEAASLDDAIAEYAPATSAFASIARHELAPDGVTVVERTSADAALRIQLAYLKAQRDAIAVAGLTVPEPFDKQIASMEEQLKPSLWTRIVNFFTGSN